MAHKQKSIDELLEERMHAGAHTVVGLDVALKQYQHLVTVMFTDIAGSTRYFEKHGDMAGLAMVQQVNDALQPCARKHKGTIVKTIGDAIMVYFKNPLEAVRASVAMQQAVDDLNIKRAKQKVAEEVRVRVALNHGQGLLKDNDVFGDVVNVCSRIEHETEAGKIGVSPSVVEALSKEKEFACRKFGTVTLRGKAKKMDLYEILWREQDLAVKPRPEKVSGEQLAVATGTRLGLEDDVRKAIEAAVKGKAKEAKALAIEKRAFTLVQVMPDQTLGKRFPLTGDTTVVGREQGDIRFGNDSLMSPEHALFTTLGGALYVEDLNSAKGVFVRIRKPHTLNQNDIIVLGRLMFRFRMLSGNPAPEAAQKSGEKEARAREGAQKPDLKGEKETSQPEVAPTPGESEKPLAELVGLLEGGKEEKSFDLYRGVTTIGRLNANYTFPDDPYLSRSHARFNVHGPRSTVEDLNSLNGTFVRIRERYLLDADDTVLVGGQLLRVIAESK